jgi:hypothetical protein
LSSAHFLAYKVSRSDYILGTNLRPIGESSKIRDYVFGIVERGLLELALFTLLIFYNNS